MSHTDYDQQAAALWAEYLADEATPATATPADDIDIDLFVF